MGAVLCGLSALALGTNAPTILRAEALDYPAPIGKGGATVFRSFQRCYAEKAIIANCSPLRERHANGKNFGLDSSLGHIAGELGPNDFHAVPVAAAQIKGLDGAAASRGMILLDEVRGRLASVFSLKSYKIDHVVHGAIASTATYGAMMDTTSAQIESATGMVVAPYIPFRAIRAGKQLSASKGASAAISTEAAIVSMNRAMRGFVCPEDIFRNPEAISGLLGALATKDLDSLTQRFTNLRVRSAKDVAAMNDFALVILEGLLPANSTRSRFVEEDLIELRPACLHRRRASRLPCHRAMI